MAVETDQSLWSQFFAQFLDDVALQWRVADVRFHRQHLQRIELDAFALRQLGEQHQAPAGV